MLVEIKNAICKRHCSDCEGEDHHWLPDYDEATFEPAMVCKHRQAQREMRDDDLEI